MKANIVTLPGDYIGPEIIAQAVKVLQAVAEKYGHEFSFDERKLGGASIDAFGVPLATQGRPLPVMAAGDSHRAMRAAAGKDDAAVYVAGDARNGSSLVVSAIADAMACAGEVAAELRL